MKKLISKILLITLIASAIIPQGIIDTSYAQTNNWDFSIPGDYTISDSTKMEVANGLGRLKYVLTHQGSIVNGGTRLLSGAYGVAVEGNYAYVASNGSNAIEIVNISNPLVPTHVSSIANGGAVLLSGPRNIIKSGNYLYVASYTSNAIEIINVTNPAAPAHAGSVTNGGTRYLSGASGLYKNGNYLYVASYTSDALEIINVTNPAAPVHAGSLRASGGRLNGAQDVFVSGNYAYVTSRLNNSLEVINISNPAAPAFAGQLTNGAGGAVLGGAYGIKIVGNYAYITSNTSNAVEVVNITNPLIPTHYSTITSGGTTLLGAPRSFAIDGNLTFVASNTSNAIEVVDMVPLSAPIHLASIANGGTTLLSGPSDVEKLGNLLYVASTTSNALEIIKAEFPTDGPSIQPVLSQSYVGTVISLAEVLGANNAGNVTYQISKNGGTTRYYYNGSAWTTTTGGTAQSSSITQINSNIASFNALAGTNTFKWKAFLNSNGSQKVELDSITLNIDNGPIVDSRSLVANRLYPIGNINFSYNYHDTGGTGINLASENVKLFKYDSGTGSYGPDIASSYISNLSTTQTQATYSSTGIPFGKYKVVFNISSNTGAPLSVAEETIIYVDAPEFIISTGSVNMGTLNTISNNFSPEVTVTVKTLGAGFDLILNKTSLMQNINLDEMVDWNGSKGIGYDKDPYSSLISKINTNEILATQALNLNTNGNKNTYTYKLKIGSFITTEQQDGNYQTNLSFGINLSY